MAENAFTKGGQSWGFGFPIQKNGVLSVYSHDRHCEAQEGLPAISISNH